MIVQEERRGERTSAVVKVFLPFDSASCEPESAFRSPFRRSHHRTHHDRLAHVLLRDLSLVDDLVDRPDGQEAVDDAGSLLAFAVDAARVRV